MWPSYSPLFTSGLLADPATAPDSPIYFTLQATKRDSSELRSFLYLDLADHKLNSPSLRRKFSMMTKSSSWSCTADAKSFYDLTRTENPTMLMSPTSPAGPARRRTSKESLRNIPSPKPAPSATLPDLPIPSDFPAPAPSHPSKKRPASIVIPSLPSPTARARRPSSVRSESVCSHVRRKGRMDALARLEGRALDRTPGSSLRNNFMSFSDDEDDKSTCKSSALSSTPVVQIDDLSAFADVEDEDVIVPRRVAALRVARTPKPGRKRRTTLDSWFPLKSFMDLKDDDLSSWNWRSFIEIGGVV